MFSSDELKFWLMYATTAQAPNRVVMTGPKALNNRYVSIQFELDGKDYLFREVRGDTVVCWTWDGFEFVPEEELSLYDVWRSKPLAIQFWSTFEFRFDTWEDFAREQTWRFRALGARLSELRWWMLGRAARFRKRVSIERFRVLEVVREMQLSESIPTDSSISVWLLGEDWMRHDAGIANHKNIQLMLKALLELQELKKEKYKYQITGAGIAALSQYEEEERKHKEAMGLQRGIRWLTVAMAIAALLQAKVVEFTPLLKWTNAWPWQ